MFLALETAFLRLAFPKWCIKLLNSTALKRLQTHEKLLKSNILESMHLKQFASKLIKRQMYWTKINKNYCVSFGVSREMCGRGGSSEVVSWPGLKASARVYPPSLWWAPNAHLT